MTPSNTSNEVKTVEEVLHRVYEAGEGLRSEAVRNSPNYDGMHVKEALATIEKLLLEAVGKDLPIGDEIAENRSYTGERIHNKIKAEIRTTLKAVLYGEKE